MIKYGLAFLLLTFVLILGMKSADSFGGFGRDRVPPEQKVAHSSHCSGCHGFDATGLALVDSEGNDVNIYDDWQISMMGLAAHDPFWRATMAHEVDQYPSAKSAIESTCLKCHAPLGSIQAHLTGTTYSYELMLADSLGLDGVSCSACHQQPAQNLGKGHSGNFTIDTNRIFFGHYPNPFQGPMQIYVGFEPVFSDHIYSSGVCAGCHTLITETLEDDGTPTGQYFVEQATYHEWLNSIYSAQGKECQSCHMPFIKDGVIIATDFFALEPREPYGLHQFFGANTAMLEMMRENKDVLNLPSGSTDLAWEESIQNNRISLKKSAELTISSLWVENDTLYFELTIKNKAGHKLPSGYPSRLAWIQVKLKDQISTDLIYTNGSMDGEGHIVGRDHPFEPHHQVSKSADDVQIYEMVMSDLHGNLTTRLNAAYQPLKDNRILPTGFNKNHFTYDTVAVWGSANLDPQYGLESTAGLDKMEYRIPLNGRDGLADLDIFLRYQTLPSRWMNDLFSNDTLSLVANFKSMYQKYQQHDEVIDSLTIENIDLSISSTDPIVVKSAITLFPNPVYGNILQVNLSGEKPDMDKFRFEIVDVNGRKIESGKLEINISLPSKIGKGVYYFLLFRETRLSSVTPFTVL